MRDRRANWALLKPIRLCSALGFRSYARDAVLSPLPPQRKGFGLSRRTFTDAMDCIHKWSTSRTFPNNFYITINNAVQQNQDGFAIPSHLPLLAYSGWLSI